MLVVDTETSVFCSIDGFDQTNSFSQSPDDYWSRGP